ncbi:hypothetical protein PsYK624_079500 [Phanerochaete sordida]|uniref:F-box domain-containing protein n=1 Tax=Phanerochaete sordida TaxID=48140 RepID=A0A9P3GCE6_9APHY|nr:hypothetical protein PsYK624_079500 [Phanerochaete sordida]
MHAVLSINEILSAVFAVTPRCSLLSAGLTCKTFYEPAMDALWYTIDSIIPLLMCLPADALGPSYPGFAGWKHRITRELTSEDWLRFQAAARRVREYIVVNEITSIRAYGFDVTHPIVLMLAEHFSEGPILPNLRRFKNVCMEARGDQLLLPRAPVRIVELNYGSSSRWLRVLNPELIPTTSLGIIRTIDSAERVLLGGGLPITKEVFLFAAMPRLSHLSFTIDDDIPLSWVQDFATLPADSFPALRSLELTCKSLTRLLYDTAQALLTLDNFLEHARPRMHFSHLIIIFPTVFIDFERSGFFHRLCRSIARHCPTIDRLEIPVGSCLADESALLPLCDLQSLCALIIPGVIIAESMAPETLQLMGSAWPRLTELRVNPHNGPATISTLRHILDIFPNLTTLAMSVAPEHDAEDELDRLESSGGARQTLQTFDLGSSLFGYTTPTVTQPMKLKLPTEQSVEQLARALAVLCPAADISWSFAWLEGDQSRADRTRIIPIMQRVVQRKREIVASRQL